MTGGRKVVRNSLFGVAAEAVGGAMSFVVVIVVARALGAESFGQFSFVLALTGIFQLVADFGLTNILVKEIARNKAETARVVGLVKPLVWLFSAVIMLCMALAAYPLATSSEVYWAVLVMGAAVLVTFHAVVFGSVCRAHEDMGYNAIAFVTHKIVLLLAVWLALHGKHGIVGVSLAYLAANLYQWLFFYLVVRKRYLGGHVRWNMDRAYWRYLIKEAFPVGVAMVFRRSSLHTGTLILTALSTPVAVGIFNAAYRVIQMVDMIPFTLSIPLFPPFSRMAMESRQRLFDALQRVMAIFMLMAAPLFFLLLFMSGDIIEVFYGSAYQAGETTLRIMAGAVLFLFQTGLLVYVFTALGEQRFYTLSSGVCLGFNVAACFVLIPFLGFTGAALATLLAEMAFFASGLWFLHRLGFALSYFNAFAKPLLAAALAASWMPWLPQDAHPAVSLALAVVGYALAYPAAVMLFGLVDRREIKLILDSVKPRPVSGSEGGA